MIRALSLAAALASAIAIPATAHENDVQITRQGDELCITSNGAPDHDIGQFPNSGNPNSFAEQNTRVCVDATPEFSGEIVERTNASGISVTGIFMRPGTADWYDASSPRGFSRDDASGWLLEGMGAAEALGMDAANAHVDHRGLYHYHAVSEAFLENRDDTLIGWAADGFEIHYIGDRVESSWQLRNGTRDSAPGGAHDGTFEQDWTYVEGAGNLDQCNGAMLDGAYVYFATDAFPFFPRCFMGEVSQDFRRRR